MFAPLMRGNWISSSRRPRTHAPADHVEDVGTGIGLAEVRGGTRHLCPRAGIEMLMSGDENERR